MSKSEYRPETRKELDRIQKADEALEFQQESNSTRLHVLTSTPSMNLSQKQVKEGQDLAREAFALGQEAVKNIEASIAVRTGPLAEDLASIYNKCAEEIPNVAADIRARHLSIGYLDVLEGEFGAPTQEMINRHPVYRQAQNALNEAAGQQDTNQNVVRALKEQREVAVNNLDVKRKRLFAF